MTQLAAIFGLSGPQLLESEKAFFKDVNPWGFILFARNIETPEQVRRLTSDLRECVGRECLVFIDQEGGRVQRLRPPHWPDYPAAATLCESYTADKAATRRAVYLHHRLIADDLRAIGVNADCAPVLDIPLPNADPIISDRAFGTIPEQVIDLAEAAMAGLITGGVAPVIKHIPGHGRALVDSHLALPKVDTGLDVLGATDLAPFKALSEAPMAMTAHVVFETVDPELPVTLSTKAFKTIIRDRIGYDGLVMSDDLDMKALSGDLKSNTEQAFKAGCDIALQCSGDMTAMQNVAKGGQGLFGKSLERATLAEMCAADITPFDRDAAEVEFEALVPSIGAAA